MDKKRQAHIETENKNKLTTSRYVVDRGLFGIPKVEAQLLNYLFKSQLPKTPGENTTGVTHGNQDPGDSLPCQMWDSCS